MNVINNIKNILENAEDIDVNSVAKKDIAIIGMSCRFPKAKNADEFWNKISNSVDCIRNFPENRKQNNMEYLRKKAEESDYYTAGYLSDIEYFDYDLFSISPKEASLMSPNQRLFLETAWHAMEDAGYGGKEIEGSNTGVFLGLSTDFGTSYKEIVETISPNSLGMAMTGNINSTTASRIAYHLDLKGPSMVIDTACSSSLAAIHYACQSLRNNECEMALAGTVKVDLVPLNQKKETEMELNITSRDDRSRSFSNDASGQGLGEGVAALLLKPLYRATADNDHIYAIIKGSAVNQDGRSVGLTAPNPKAQEEVIVKAWEDAQIDPLTIACIEAHGTGTRLGDPVEVEGIQRAFRRYTNKKQFCAIGTVKTNIGHLDHAAGMAGIIKMILSLQYKEIPALIHFKQPNKIINFLDSPVYVNDMKRKWEKSEHPRIGGVSAFGLSGTNCHIILQEAPEKKVSPAKSNALNLLTMSAKNETALLELAAEYIHFLNKNKNININDLCYTANIGRKYFPHRLAIIFDTRKTLIQFLYKIINSSRIENYESNIFYSVCKNTPLKEVHEKEDNLILNAAKHFVYGAEVNWRGIYKSGDYQRISLPGYPFSKTRCWVEEYSDSRLLGKCILKLYDRVVYEREFNYRSHWAINEHIVNGKYVMPGAALIEMVVEAIKENYSGELFELQEIVFLSALAVNDKERIKVHTILTLEKDRQEFIVVSQSNHNKVWNKNVTGKLSFNVSTMDKTIDIKEVKNRFYEYNMVEYDYEAGNEIILSDRWNCIKEIRVSKEEYFAKLELNPKYVNHQENYFLHPSLLDEAVNLALRSISKDLYLPFSYKKFTFYNSMPNKFYCLVKQNQNKFKKDEIAVFDIQLLDESGKVFADINHYVIKKANNLFEKKVNKTEYYNFIWKEKSDEKNPIEVVNKKILIFRGENERSKNIANILKSNGYIVTEVIVGKEISVLNQEVYQVDGTQQGYIQLFQHIKLNSFSDIMHLLSLDSSIGIHDITDLEQKLNNGIYSLFHVIKGIFQNKWKNKLQLTIVSDYANCVTSDESFIKPYNAALQGLTNAVSKEASYISCRFIDMDNTTSVLTIMNEIQNTSDENLVAFRGDRRFIREIHNVDMDKYKEMPVTIQKDGVYIITGGLGSLGYECAKYLAGKENVTLIFLNRSELPYEDTWNAILKKETDKELCTKIKRVRDIRSRGSVVMNYSLDISDYNAAEKIFLKIREKFKHINGIIHCAGVAGNGFLFRKELNQFHEVLLPKVQGTYVLDKLTEQDDLDFFVMFSSISSFIFEEGQTDYAAANAFLDSYSYYRNQRGKKTISINWPAWEETGMAFNYGVDMEQELFTPLKTADAIGCFDTIIHKDVLSIIVGKLNIKLAAKKIQTDEMKVSDEILYKVNLHEKKHTQINLQIQSENQVQNVATENEAMTLGDIIDSLTQIWCNALGLDGIDINAKFFDVGGNSIIAIYMGKEINMKFPEIIEVSDIFTYNTISEMADYIFNVINGKKETNIILQDNLIDREDSLDDLLDKIENGEIGEEEIELLGEKSFL